MLGQDELTYERAKQMIEKRAPRADVLVEAQASSFKRTPQKIVADLFIRAKGLLATESKKHKDKDVVRGELKEAIEEYMTALERFEKGLNPGGEPVQGKSIADLL